MILSQKQNKATGCKTKMCVCVKFIFTEMPVNPRGVDNKENTIFRGVS